VARDCSVSAAVFRRDGKKCSILQHSRSEKCSILLKGKLLTAIRLGGARSMKHAFASWRQVVGA
jgi:hypothetical protein